MPPSTFPSGTPSYSPTAYPSKFPSTAPSEYSTSPPSQNPSQVTATIPPSPTGMASVPCYPQGPCDPGYMDTTNGNSKHWQCGANCVGGAHRTNGVCNCACKPEAPCPTSEPTQSSVTYVNPTTNPSPSPSVYPSINPSASPTKYPTIPPSQIPTGSPTSNPSAAPSKSPSNSPSLNPSAIPSMYPSEAISTSYPTTIVTEEPTTTDNEVPYANQTGTEVPTTAPSIRPTTTNSNQTAEPTQRLIAKTTHKPTKHRHMMQDMMDDTTEPPTMMDKIMNMPPWFPISIAGGIIIIICTIFICRNKCRKMRVSKNKLESTGIEMSKSNTQHKSSDHASSNTDRIGAKASAAQTSMPKHYKLSLEHQVAVNSSTFTSSLASNRSSELFGDAFHYSMDSGGIVTKGGSIDFNLAVLPEVAHDDADVDEYEDFMNDNGPQNQDRPVLDLQPGSNNPHAIKRHHAKNSNGTNTVLPEMISPKGEKTRGVKSMASIHINREGIASMRNVLQNIDAPIDHEIDDDGQSPIQDPNNEGSDEMKEPSSKSDSNSDPNDNFRIPNVVQETLGNDPNGGDEDMVMINYDKVMKSIDVDQIGSVDSL